MKAKIFCKTALIAILGVSVVGTTSTSYAAPSELTSKGTVKVEEGTAGGTDSPGVDPEDPTKPLPEPDPKPGGTTNPDTGSLMIEKNSNLDFGTIKTSANEVISYAKPVSYNNGSTTRGNYVQWADVRSGGTYGYTVTAQLSSQFKDSKGANVLKGSTINFTNGIISAQGDNSNTIPSNVKTSFELTEQTNDAKTIVEASNKNKEGKGRYIMAFGKSTDSTDSNSVKLSVPASTASNMAATDYTAIVTWKITAAPAEEEPVAS